MIKKIAIQGDTASFHDMAAQKYFGANYQAVNCDSFAEVFAAVESGQASQAICAIENSLFGSINETYDLLVKYKFNIVGEVYLRIKQCLITLPGVTLADIKEVYSHPVALAQCEDYLDSQLPAATRLEFHDTAASVEKIKTLGLKNAAAIASRSAAELHGMNILASQIETNKHNYTRFIVLESSGRPRAGGSKTSLIINTGQQPGALYRALGAFADRSLNLSKLQSRPIVGKAWHYIFYVDVEAGIGDTALSDALKELADQGSKVVILGSYQAGTKVE